MLKYIIITCLSTSALLAQENNEYPNQLRLVWYNLENAFDTIDDPQKNDEDFLPSSPRNWNSWKYWSKLNRLAKVIRNSTGYYAPDIIGVCEIENAEVLYDLSRRPGLRNTEYRLIHYDSPDKRGIDVALLYNPEKIHFFESDTLHINLPDGYPTRLILTATGILQNDDTLHVVMNHWPSRRGGAETSEPKRVLCANRTRVHLEELTQHYPTAQIVMAGDFNDGPSDKSLCVLCDSLENSNLLLRCHMRDLPPFRGTHAHAGNWAYLDQWVTGGSQSKRLLQIDSIYVYKRPFLMKQNTRLIGETPYRSWMGNFFTNGYSDHLPIVLILDVPEM